MGESVDVLSGEEPIWLEAGGGERLDGDGRVGTAPGMEPGPGKEELMEDPGVRGRG